MVHVAHAAQQDFWLTARIQDCKVATEKETASAKCFLRIHWQDIGFLAGIGDWTAGGNLEALRRSLDGGDQVYGMVGATSKDSCPFNIDVIFLNQISAERIDSLCWTKYDKQKGLVSVSACAIKPTTPVIR